MNQAALDALRQKAHETADRDWSELTPYVGDLRWAEFLLDEKTYAIETVGLWDGEPDGDIRVVMELYEPPSSEARGPRLGREVFIKSQNGNVVFGRS